MSKLRKRLIGLVILFLLTWVGFKSADRNHHLSLVPKALNVTTVLYVSEQFWGFGPGGNETGLLVFELPEAAARELSVRGLEFLKKVPERGQRDKHRSYSGWRETPLKIDARWGLASDEQYKASLPPAINEFLNRYGFAIPVEKKWTELTDRALSSKGNYYAYGGSGIIVIIPKEFLVIYAYSG